MEQLAREDIAAAAAAHRELGRDYDGAVAEGLIERIGAEIDKRVDARLAQRGDDHPGLRGGHPAQRSGGGRPGSGPGVAGIFLALGSMGIGLGAAAAVLAENSAGTGLVALIWVVIAVINVAYARRR